MIQILEYIAAHYAWFLGGAILVLLAIIGYYADKTNFGQGKNIESENDKPKDITNMTLSGAIGEEEQKKDTVVKEDTVEGVALEPQKTEDASKKETFVKENFDEKEIAVHSANDNIVTEQQNKEKTSEEIAFEKFNEEFDSVLPKKEVITTDLLSDIDELSLERTQKINLAELPDLDDIELPKIKNLVNEEQDVWKF